MTNKTLYNKSIPIPNLHFRNPHAWNPYTPGVSSYKQDPLADTIEEAEARREQWGDDVSDPNYFATALDETEAHYGAELESVAVDLDKEVDDEDEDQYVDPSDDEDSHEEVEGEHDRA